MGPLVLGLGLGLRVVEICGALVGSGTSNNSSNTSLLKFSLLWFGSPSSRWSLYGVPKS